MADIFGTIGDDVLPGTNGDDLIAGDLGNDILQGLEGADKLVGDEGSDTLEGGDGDDSLWAGIGDDSIIGGSGTDTAYYDSDGSGDPAGLATQGAAVDLSLGTAVDGWGFADTITGIENAVGTSFDDILVGDLNANFLSGYNGNDSLSGGGGNDTLYGGGGADVLIGGDGDDLLDGYTGNDTIHGNAGNDGLAGGQGDDGLFGDAGDDRFWGAAGNDTIDGGDGYDIAYFQTDGFGDPTPAGVTVNLSTGTAIDGWGDTDTLVSIEEIVGTVFADSLTGNAGSNTLYGWDGDDTIIGGIATSWQSSDYLYGEDGNDTIKINSGFAFGGAGDDRILGQSTTSTYASAGVSYSDATSGIIANLTDSFQDGLEGGDSLDGFRVADGLGGVDLISDLHVIYGSEFDDVFYVDSTWTAGGANSVQIRLGEGDDYAEFLDVANAEISYVESGGGVVADLSDGTATDVITGAGFVGADTFSGVNRFYGSNFADVIYGTYDDDFISGGAGNDTIYGRYGNDGLFGGAGNDLLEGGYQDNWLDGESGDDLMRGGDGDDVYVVNSASDTIDESDSDGEDEVHTYISFDLNTSARVIGSFERLYLQGTADISGTGNSLNNVIGGNAGANSLAGYAGNDDLYGDTGNDTLSGGTGNDWLDGGAGNDVMRGGAGNDIYIVNSSGDTIDEKTSGSSGTDEVQSSISFNLNASSRVLGSFEKLFLTGSANINGTGNSLSNDIGGNAGANILVGNAGNDGLYGNGGNDTLSGGAGNDTLHGGAGADIMRGGAGNDAYVVDNSKDTVDERASGSSGSDTVHSSISFNLNASARVLGSIEKLALTGSGNINGIGNSLNNTIYGNDGANILMGNAGNDSLYGNGGNDRITGGAGNDQLAGGGGKDIFVFNAALSSTKNVDQVFDFNHVYDTIWLDNAVMKALGGTGALKSSQFWKSTSGKAHDSNDHIIYDTDSGNLFYDSNGSGSGGSTMIAHLAPHLSLDATDFFVV